MRRTAEDVIEIGNALIRQKEKLPHGMFLPWIEAEFDMSQSAADRFVQFARVYTGKLPTVGNLPPTALYELAAPSTPPEIQAEVERRIAAGELVSAERGIQKCGASHPSNTLGWRFLSESPPQRSAEFRWAPVDITT
jgi:hypothetical protein